MKTHLYRYGSKKLVITEKDGKLIAEWADDDFQKIKKRPDGRCSPETPFIKKS